MNRPLTLDEFVSNQDVLEKEYQEAERVTEIIEEPRAKKKGASTQSAGEDYSAKGEFERFKKEPQLHHDEHALEWWKNNHEPTSMM